MEGKDFKRYPRQKANYEDFDLTVPVDFKKVKEVEENIEQEESCFGRGYNPENKYCSMCNDSEMCGIVFHQLLKKRTKVWEASRPKTLDQIDFDGIEVNTILMWLKLSQHTTKEFVAKIKAMSKCDDDETVLYWCKSFIKDNVKLYTKEGTVYVRD